MKILVVEDDHNVMDIIIEALREEDYTVEGCDNGADAVSFATTYSYDLIVLDRMLPSKNGIQVMKELQQKGVKSPILMVTAMDGLNDKITGLDAGADDYLIKPFDMKELLARTRALLRRPRETQTAGSCCTFGVSLNLASGFLTFENNAVTLSKKEIHLMEYFLLHPNITLGRERIISRVWGSDADITDGNLDNYIYFIRRRLKTLKAPIVISTVYGMGYRLERISHDQ